MSRNYFFALLVWEVGDLGYEGSSGGFQTDMLPIFWVNPFANLLRIPIIRLLKCSFDSLDSIAALSPLTLSKKLLKLCQIVFLRPVVSSVTSP